MSEEPLSPEPAVGAMWFPDEGGIMFRGKAYLPHDYIFTSTDIRRAKAGALRDAADSWGDGHEGFPYWWLIDRANMIEGKYD